MSNTISSSELDTWVANYHRDGYLIVPGLLDAGETAALRDITDRITARAAGMSEDSPEFDFEDGHTPQAPLIQRMKKPHRIDPYYFELAKHELILAFIARIVGNDIRLNHSKMNMKAARVGSALEWHQDWAFAPHTNMSTCVASVMLDDASLANGAMQVIPGSHKGPLLEHHDPQRGFIGAINAARDGIDVGTAAAFAGPAGTIAFHHPLAIHGSGANRSGAPRRILFLEYAAADAWPMFYPVEWEEYNSRIVAGKETSAVRCEPNKIKLPFPTMAGSSIYRTQANIDDKARFFDVAAA
jgi:ectoine hydroxylase-related dioxygenase (phytanoyl-CoA dioxygenase family)